MNLKELLISKSKENSVRSFQIHKRDRNRQFRSSCSKKNFSYSCGVTFWLETAYETAGFGNELTVKQNIALIKRHTVLFASLNPEAMTNIPGPCGILKTVTGS